MNEHYIALIDLGDRWGVAMWQPWDGSYRCIAKSWDRQKMVELAVKLRQGTEDRDSNPPECSDAIGAWNARPKEGRFREAVERLHAFVTAEGQAHEEAALGRAASQSKAYDEERALVCWQILDEIEALLQGAGEAQDDTEDRDASGV